MISNAQVQCQCGCGEFASARTLSGTPRKYIDKHSAKMRSVAPETRRSRSGGYPTVYRPDHPSASSSGFVAEHKIKAEAALGRVLPKGVHVHHFNEIKSDNSNANLVICEDSAYHILLHKRQRVLRLGGNPNADKVCCGCQQPKPFSAFGTCGKGRLNNLCRICRSEYEWNARRGIRPRIASASARRSRPAMSAMEGIRDESN